MGELRGIVSDFVSIIATLGGMYFFAGFVINLIQSQVSSVTGDIQGRARAMQQGVAMVILLCIAVSVHPISRSFTDYITLIGDSSTPVDKASLIGFWGSIVNLVVIGATGVSITLLTVSAVFNGLGLQVSRMLGIPADMSRSAGNLITIIIGIAFTLSAVTISRTILNEVLKFISRVY